MRELVGSIPREKWWHQELIEIWSLLCQAHRNLMIKQTKVGSIKIFHQAIQGKSLRRRSEYKTQIN